ncbi:MAG TPA: fumarylacetoacetate hydrolase family protein [Flavitalea sp.]|nr:fumarylacetoacetate hydrolase family protein [Flavitalea sp.]
MHLYKVPHGVLLISGGKNYFLHEKWDTVINRQALSSYLQKLCVDRNRIDDQRRDQFFAAGIQAPIGQQEVWAAGVTYLRSRDARMEESKDSGGADFYQKVYQAERPELFFKSAAERVAAHGEEVYIRRDSLWNVPEPELTLFINAEGTIEGYTIGNDMSSRSIEGENPLYLPQAKVYERSTALGPCLYVPENPISTETMISITITRNLTAVFSGSVSINRIKRPFTELVEFLYRECRFPAGCFLMTGTGIVPADDFTLQRGDIVAISIEGIGVLENTVSIMQSETNKRAAVTGEAY